MFITFNDEVHHNSIDTLIKEVIPYLGSGGEKEKKIDLYFSTNGGEMSTMYSFIHFLNLNKDAINIHIYNALHSCGADLLHKFRGQVFIHHDTFVWMVLHRGDRRIQTLSQVGRVNETKLMPSLKKNNKEDLKAFKKLGVSKKNLKKIKNGKDAVLYPEDVLKLRGKNITHVK